MKSVKLFMAFYLGMVVVFPSGSEMLARSTGSGDQDLYMPKEVRRAYQRGTRDKSGMPGKGYWQNKTDYRIAVQIDPQSRLLSGNEEVTFSNNSPDTLRTIVFHLYQNINVRGGVRNSQLAPEAVSDGMTITKLTLDGKQLQIGDGSNAVSIQGAVMYVRTPKAVPPGAKLHINIAWSFIIPKGSNIRMGTYADNVFFLGYWYPKIAVYDDVHGWDTFAYNGEHEFYHEYGDYQVEIDVPNTYGVWGTGELANPEAVLTPVVLGKYRQSKVQRDIIHVIGKSDFEQGAMYQTSTARNTWKYHAFNVPDFAFGMAENYMWDAASVEVENGRRANINVVYDTSTAPFRVVAQEAVQTLEFLSTEFPGVPYPYPQITVFRGDYGMEFPMIVNDGVFPNRITNVYVHTHEIAHQYFPFYVGTNETLYAWMDEGWAYALPIELQKHLSDFDHRIRATKGYAQYAGGTYDLPLMTPSTCLRAPDLDMASYYKPAVAYEMLKDVLGEDAYTKSLKEYIHRWNGKHPLPYDFFYTMEDVSGTDLTWFWQTWFFEEGVPDIAVAEVNTRGDEVRFMVQNLGDKPIPIHATITSNQGAPFEIHHSAAVWRDGATEFWIDASVPGGAKSIVLGTDLIPDSNPGNNTWNEFGG